MPKNKTLILAACVGLLSFLPRLALISKGPYHIDCLNLVIKAQETLATGQLQPLFGWGYPLTVLLASLFVALFDGLNIGDPGLAVNFMSVVFGALAVSAYYLFTRKFLNETAALFGAFFFSFHPIFFGISLYGKSHAPSLFFLLAGLICLLYAHSARRTALVLLSGFFFGLMGAARLHDLILMLPAIILLLIGPLPGRSFTSILRGQKTKWLLFFGLIGITVIACHLPFFLSQSEIYDSHLKTFWKMGVTNNFVGPVSSFLITAGFMLTFSLTPIGMLLSLAGGLRLIQRDKQKALFLLLWLAVPLFFYGNLKTLTSRFLVISVIPLTITEGYFLATLFSFRKIIFKISCCLVCLLIFGLTFWEVYPIFRFRHEQAALPDCARWIASMTEPHAVIIMSDERLFTSYYGRRTTWHNPCGTISVNKNYLPRFKAKLDRKLDDNIPIYITSFGLHAGDHTGEFTRFMVAHYELKHIGRHLTEDYHRGATHLNIGYENLFRIKAKKTNK